MTTDDDGPDTPQVPLAGPADGIPAVRPEPDVEDSAVEADVMDPAVEADVEEPVARRKWGTRDPLASVLIGVLTLLLGFAFMVQIRAADDTQLLAGAREEDLVRILDELNGREERLRTQITDQRAALEQLTSSDSQAVAALEEATRRAEAIGILNGTVVARGPGLEIVIRDPADAVRVADLLDVIQELRGAGAETMQIDGIRIGVSTAITGRPAELMIDGHPISAPYEVVVIGSPQYMETALNIPGGVVQDVTRLGGSVRIAQSQDVVVDALRPLDTPEYASPETAD